jgi:DNA-binding NtrC family response regulator
VERELFGFAERSFPAASCEQSGALEFCHDGVLFLEDIGELPLTVQSNLLHVMEEKQYFRPGTGHEVQADVRILAGTKVGLDEALAGGRIRADFYFHLSTFTIHLPSLRQRREDIPLLLEYFMSKWAVKYARPAVRFTQAALDACMAYSWPGNLVELENFVKRYLIIGDEAVALSDLRAVQEKHGSSPPPDGTTEWADRSNEQSLKNIVRQLRDEAEIEEITKALQQTQWNRHEAARRLKISYRGLLYKIQHYHLRPPSPVRPT